MNVVVVGPFHFIPTVSSWMGKSSKETYGSRQKRVCLLGIERRSPRKSLNYMNEENELDVKFKLFCM
jgi:hypothetical protein